MLKQLERPGEEKPQESSPFRNDDGMAQKAAEARALLAKIEERKMKDAEELSRKAKAEFEALYKESLRKRGVKGGYCGCL